MHLDKVIISKMLSKHRFTAEELPQSEHACLAKQGA